MQRRKLPASEFALRLNAIVDQHEAGPTLPIRAKLRSAADVLGVTFSALNQQFLQKGPVSGVLKPNGNWFVFEGQPFARGHIGEIVAVYADNKHRARGQPRVSRTIVQPTPPKTGQTDVDEVDTLAALALLEKVPEAVNIVFTALTQVIQENELLLVNNEALDQANKKLANRLAEVTRQKCALEVSARNGHPKPVETDLGHRLSEALKGRTE